MSAGNLSKSLQEMAENLINHSHPIDHDPSDIDHPFWPIVSLLARDLDEELIDWINPFKAKERTKDHPSMFQTYFGPSFDVSSLLNVLTLREGEFFNPRPIKRGLYSVVAQFFNRELGLLIAYSAGAASKGPLSFAGFVYSSRQNAFLHNANLLAKLKPRNSESFEEAWRAASQWRDEENGDWYLENALEEYRPRTTTEMDLISQIWVNAKKASDKRNKLSLPPKVNRVSEALRRNWLIRGLWCRSTKGILKCFPEMQESDTAEGFYRAIGRIDVEITKLGLSKGRRPDLESGILKAEQLMMRNLKSTEIST